MVKHQSMEHQEIIADKVASVFGADAAVSSLVALTGDASSRRYYRAAVEATSAPQSVIVMALPEGSSLPLSSEELGVFKQSPKELPFLNMHRFLSGIGVRVPKLYGHWVSEGILLLEDLGDTALWDRVQGLTKPEVLTWYEKAIDELLGLQIRGTQARDQACIAFQQRFDFRLYMWEFDHFLEYVDQPILQHFEPDRVLAGDRFLLQDGSAHLSGSTADRCSGDTDHKCRAAPAFF